MIALEQKCMADTGITLKVEVVPQDEVDTKMQTALSAKSSAYDIIGIDIIDLAKFDAAGWLTPLDSYIDAATKADILPFALEGISYNGKILGLPWKSEYMVFVYNKKMLSDAGFKSRWSRYRRGSKPRIAPSSNRIVALCETTQTISPSCAATARSNAGMARAATADPVSPPSGAKL